MADDLTPERLRRLAAVKPERARVLSLYLNLDPTEFATGEARATAISSLIDDAGRQAKNADLPHDEHTALRKDVERAADFLRGPEFSADGAHALAVFACGPAGLFETLKLPRPLDSRAVIDDSPFVEPLAGMMGKERWCVALVNRRIARILTGGPHGLEEAERIDDGTPGQHQQGGWSQARYQRAIDEEAIEHFRNTAHRLFRRRRDAPYDRLLLGAPSEMRTAIEDTLHADVRERLVGFIDVDVENTKPDEVRRAAAPAIEEYERRREREALDRLVEGVRAGGRGAAGVEETLGALNERRVEVLLLDEGFSAPGSVCATCGHVSTSEGGTCPVDEGPLEPRDDVVQTAIELALDGSADLMVVRHHDDLGSMGSIGAVLRF